MKFFRLSSAVVALLMLASCAAGGASETTQTTDSSVSESPVMTDTTAANVPNLPDADYGGHNFHVLLQVAGYGIYNNEHIYIEGENGEILNDAIYNRNRRVEERFHVKISETALTEDTQSTMKNAVAAGDDVYDIVMFTNPPSGIGTEYLLDIRSLSHINIDMPWWDQNYINAMSVDGKLITAVSSLMITHMDSVFAMFFNKSLADAYDLPDLYQIVRDGKWTLDKWAEISKNVTKDLNGDGTMDDLDLYAFIGLEGISRLASGIPLDAISKNSDDIPQISFSDAMTERLLAIRTYADNYQMDIYDPRSDKNTGTDGDRAVFRLFENDQALFFVHGLGSSQVFRAMKNDFGILPTPKLDEAQEVYFSEPDKTKCFGIPTTASDPTRTAVLLEALSYEGYTYLKPLYYESMLQSKYLRDEESIEMMDQYIYSNIGFTPYICSSTLISTIKTLITGKSEVASLLESKRKTIEKEIEKYVSLFSETNH